MSVKRTVEESRDKATEGIEDLYYWAGEMLDAMRKIESIASDADENNWREAIDEISNISGQY